MTLLSCFKIYYKLESTAIIAKLTMFIALISLYDELSLLALYINKLMKVFQAYKIIFIGFLEIVFCTKKRKLSEWFHDWSHFFTKTSKDLRLTPHI